MRARGAMVAVMIAMLFACGGSPATPAPDAAAGLAYTASVGWDIFDDPEIQSMTVDGQGVTGMSYTFHRSYDNYAEAAGSSVPVEVTTGSGTFSFLLVPTDCGQDTDLCGGSGEPSCADLTAETEDWTVHEGLLVRGLVEGSLELTVDSGTCTFSDGTQGAWSD